MGFHLPDLLIILAIALLIFGPKKLPEMGSAIGKSLRAFHKGMNELSNPEDTELSVPPSEDAPPISEKDLMSAASKPTTSGEVNTEKQA